MLATGISPLCKTMLGIARAKEQAGPTGAGLAWLHGVQSGLGAVIEAGGQQMISASTAGKAFSFAAGWSNQVVAEALTEALGIWQTYSTSQLAAVLDVRPVRVVTATFGSHPFAYGGPCSF